MWDSQKRYQKYVPNECDLCLRFTARFPSFSLRTAFRLSWAAFRDSGWKIFSFLTVFEVDDLPVFEGAMMVYGSKSI